jgi:hypothetical protein
VVRFYVSRGVSRARAAYVYCGCWFVCDMDSRGIAGKTSKSGYESKKEAVRVAREYRDKYGAYTKVPF